MYRASDIYVNDGERQPQIAGLSARHGHGYALHRACWYEVDPLPEIGDLLRADGIEPEEFRAALALANEGFFSSLINRFDADTIGAEDYISPESRHAARELQKQKKGNKRGSCVLGEVT